MGRNGKKTPLYVHIYRILRGGILSGKFSPGTILPSENSLCTQYNTSRHTVRTSLKKLDAEGIARNLPGRGWEVIKSDGITLKRYTSTLAFIGRGDIESSYAFESIRKSYQQYFSEIRYYVGSANRDSAWYDEFSDNEIAGGKTGGVIVFDDNPLPEKFVDSLKSGKIPFICLPLNGNYRYDSIGTDNLAASEIMLNYLFRQGHTNIIFVTSRDLDNIPSFSLRRAGYSMAMERNGLIPEIIIADHNYWQGQDEEKLLMGKIDSMKSEKRHPSCIFCSTSTPVVELLAMLKRNSIRVPEEISICSFGCTPEMLTIASKFGITSLTYIEEQFDVMSAVALEILSMKSGTSIPVSMLVPVKLMEGNSVASLNQPDS